MQHIFGIHNAKESVHHLFSLTDSTDGSFQVYNSSAQLHRILIHLILVSQLVLLAMTERPAFQFIFSFCASNTQERRLSAIIYSSRFLQLFNLKLFRSVFVLRSFNSILIITSCRTTPCQLHLLQLYVRSLCHNCSRGPRT